LLHLLWIEEVKVKVLNYGDGAGRYFSFDLGGILQSVILGGGRKIR